MIWFMVSLLLGRRNAGDVGTFLGKLLSSGGHERHMEGSALHLLAIPKKLAINFWSVLGGAK